jgi:hypothetical protein
MMHFGTRKTQAKTERGSPKWTRNPLLLPDHPRRGFMSALACYRQLRAPELSVDLSRIKAGMTYHTLDLPDFSEEMDDPEEE